MWNLCIVGNDGNHVWYMITLYERQQIDTDVKNSLLDSMGEREGGMIWENGIETCILS